MEVYCKQTFMSSKYQRYYYAGFYYKLDPDEDLNNNNGCVFIYSRNMEGLRFTLSSIKQNDAEPFDQYFDQIKKVRKLKLNKLKEIIKNGEKH